MTTEQSRSERITALEARAEEFLVAVRREHRAGTYVDRTAALATMAQAHATMAISYRLDALYDLLSAFERQR